MWQKQLEVWARVFTWSVVLCFTGVSFAEWMQNLTSIWGPMILLCFYVIAALVVLAYEIKRLTAPCTPKKAS